LVHVKQKADDIYSSGTPDQQANLSRRTAELQKEFLRRNPPGGGGARADAPHGSGAGSAASEGGDDESPAGPDAGPVDDQPGAS
jgi:hypothetical protein